MRAVTERNRRAIFVPANGILVTAYVCSARHGMSRMTADNLATTAYYVV